MAWYAWLILGYFLVGVRFGIVGVNYMRKSDGWDRTSMASKVIVIVVLIWPISIVYDRMKEREAEKLAKRYPSTPAGLVVPDGKGGHEVIHFGRRDQE